MATVSVAPTLTTSPVETRLRSDAPSRTVCAVTHCVVRNAASSQLVTAKRWRGCRRRACTAPMHEQHGRPRQRARRGRRAATPVVDRAAEDERHERLPAHPDDPEDDAAQDRPALQPRDPQQEARRGPQVRRAGVGQREGAHVGPRYVVAGTSDRFAGRTLGRVSEVWTTMPSPVGELLLVADDDGLTRCTSRRSTRRRAPPDAGRAAAAARPSRQLGEYFAGERTAFDLPLAPAGTGVPAPGVGRAGAHPVRHDHDVRRGGAAARRPEVRARRRARERPQPDRRSSCRATGSSARTASCAATPAASSASRPCSRWSSSGLF